MKVRVEPLLGEAIGCTLPDLARLRIEVFRDYPYLYDGDLAYEVNYLDRFSQAPDALIVAAFDGDRLIGASTGAPLRHQQESFRTPFTGKGISVDEVFYFGESVLLADYRGQGLGHVFFDERENHARSLPETRICAFCSVIRPDGHPARPAGYRSHDRFWRKRGYTPLEGVIARFAWREVGATGETEHSMQFWMRPI